MFSVFPEDLAGGCVEGDEAEGLLGGAAERDEDATIVDEWGAGVAPADGGFEFGLIDAEVFEQVKGPERCAGIGVETSEVTCGPECIEATIVVGWGASWPVATEDVLMAGCDGVFPEDLAVLDASAGYLFFFGNLFEGEEAIFDSSDTGPTFAAGDCPLEGGWMGIPIGIDLEGGDDAGSVGAEKLREGVLNVGSGLVGGWGGGVGGDGLVSEPELGDDFAIEPGEGVSVESQLDTAGDPCESEKG